MLLLQDKEVCPRKQLAGALKGRPAVVYATKNESWNHEENKTIGSSFASRYL